MSELTRCNYCSLLNVQRNAASRDMTVHLIPDDGWILVIVCPVNTVPDREEHWVMSMMAISDHCVC